MRYSHFAHIDDPGQFRRKLTPEQEQRVVRMREERRLTWSAIAHWFTRNETPITYKTAKRAYRRAA